MLSPSPKLNLANLVKKQAPTELVNRRGSHRVAISLAKSGFALARVGLPIRLGKGWDPQTNPMADALLCHKNARKTEKTLSSRAILHFPVAARAFPHFHIAVPLSPSPNGDAAAPLPPVTSSRPPSSVISLPEAREIRRPPCLPRDQGGRDGTDACRIGAGARSRASSSSLRRRSGTGGFAVIIRRRADLPRTAAQCHRADLPRTATQRRRRSPSPTLTQPPTAGSFRHSHKLAFHELMRMEMQKSDHHEQNLTSPRGLIHKVLRRTSSRRSPTAADHNPSPVFVETSNSKFLKQKDIDDAIKDPEKAGTHDNRIEDEKSDLLGYEMCSGKLTLDNKAKSASGEQSGSGSSSNCFDARLTTEALVWGSNILKLEDIVSVSYHSGLRHFTVHACPLEKRSSGLSCFMKPRRTQKDLRFLSTSPHDAFWWVKGFADQQCYVNLLPHPMASSKKHSSELIPFDNMFDPYVKCRYPPKILVILNPRSGHGRSSKVFHGKVEPIFKLAGFKMEVVKTTHAGHAKSLVSTIDFSTCPDGIVCVGGDGIVNEVLNGLLCRDDQNVAVSVPIGIIPAGSDNSLVWTVLGVKDPISAAMSIVRGGLTPIDVFAVEWIQSGTIHFGTTVSYFGFVSDVLELSEKYQKRFGPLRYFVAGFLKFLCLPKYSFELEYLPVSDVSGGEHKIVEGQEKVDASDLYDDVVRRSRVECLPRASSLSSIDSIMSTGIMSGGDLEVSSPRANNEPSELVRALDPKSKRLSLGRTSTFNEPEEVIHPQAHVSSTPSWRKSKSKSRTDKAWPGSSATNDAKSSRGTTIHDKEDASSTISDPGPVWDSGPKWDDEPKWDNQPKGDNQPNWEPETPIDLPGPLDDIELGLTKELVPSLDERWTVRKGRYLGVLVCNHSCKTVQSLSSQVIAPKAEYDDNCLDLLLVGGSGRLRLLRFLVLLQFGKHISLPNVEYLKVKSVRLKAGPNTHDGCGIDGELLHVKGQVRCSLLPQQCRLIGRPTKNPVQ